MDSLIEGQIPHEAHHDDALAEQPTGEVTERQAATPYEPFLQDWYAAPAPQEVGSLTLTNRQLAIIGFVGILTVGMMAGLGYVAGRVASNGPSRVLMLESAQQQATASPAAAAEVAPSKVVAAPTVASLAQVSAASKETPAKPSAIPTVDPVLGQKLSPVAPKPRTTEASSTGVAFWQVGALDPGMAKVSEKYLLDAGLPVRLEAISGSAQLRVLVGPAEGIQLDVLKTRLDDLGFQPFLKRY
jgi:hypothetical protein